MIPFTEMQRRFARGALPGALLLGAAVVALAEPVGGTTVPSYGPGRIVLPRSGRAPVEFVANLRFGFDGAPSDTSGTGTVTAYDAIGQTPVAEFPFTWTLRRGSTVTMALDSDGFAAFLGDRIEEGTGLGTDVTLASVALRGKLRDGGASLAVAIKASGQASLGAGGTYPMKVKAHCR